MRKLLLLAVLLAISVTPALCGVAVAQQKQSEGTGSEELLSFVQKFKGRFPSEIKDQSILEKSYQGRVLVYLYSGLVEGITYDDAKAQLTMDFDKGRAPARAGFISDTILNRCKYVGQGSGMTGMGVRGVYSKEVCHQVVLKDPPRDMPMITISATPAIYRLVEKKGIEIVTVVKLQTGSGAVVEYGRVRHPAYIDHPVETDLHHYTITAQVLERQYYLPGTKTPLSIVELRSATR